MTVQNQNDPRGSRVLYGIAIGPLAVWVGLLQYTRSLPFNLQLIVGGALIAASLSLLVTVYAIRTARGEHRAANQLRKELNNQPAELIRWKAALLAVLRINFEALLRQRGTAGYSPEWGKQTHEKLNAFLDDEGLDGLISKARRGELPFEPATGTPITTLRRWCDDLRHATRYSK